jgi:predicted nucleic acid-binding protein
LTLVLDASVAAAWFFPDEINDYSDGIMAGLQTTGALVPAIWPLEVTNVMLVGERNGRLTEAQTAYLLQFLCDMPIRIDDALVVSRLSSVLNLAREHRLSVYDASYLELAMREGLALATQDRRLREAAERAGVPIA